MQKKTYSKPTVEFSGLDRSNEAGLVVVGAVVAVVVVKVAAV